MQTILTEWWTISWKAEIRLGSAGWEIWHSFSVVCITVYCNGKKKHTCNTAESVKASIFLLLCFKNDIDKSFRKQAINIFKDGRKCLSVRGCNKSFCLLYKNADRKGIWMYCKKPSCGEILWRVSNPVAKNWNQTNSNKKLWALFWNWQE